MTVFANRCLQLQKRLFAVCLSVGAATLPLPLPLPGAELVTPNASFENPVGTEFGFNVSVQIANWEKMPEPTGYDDSGGFLWEQLMGLFQNTPEGNSDHITNMHGDQALWIFAVPGAGVFQDYASGDSFAEGPLQEFAVKYEPGLAYELTVAVLGGGGGMETGVPLEIRLYYRDDAGQRVPVRSMTVINTLETFPTITEFVDFTLRLPVVRPEDPWANRYLGIAFLSQATSENEGGYWDVDDVRLRAAPRPGLELSRPDPGQVRLRWLAARGYDYQLLQATSPLGAAFSEQGAVVPGSGVAVSRDLAMPGDTAFYRLAIVPSAEPIVVDP